MRLLSTDDGGVSEGPAIGGGARRYSEESSEEYDPAFEMPLVELERVREALMSNGEGHPFGEVDHHLKRAFLVAYSQCGVKSRAARHINIAPETVYSPSWRNDHIFQAALERAEVMAADILEAEAHRRAVEGVRQYKFHHGEPVAHPELCQCGHGLRFHRQDSDPHIKKRPCTHPDCGDCLDFEGAPYYEHSYSDSLLKFMLTGALPQKYGTKRVEWRGMLANLNLDSWPDHLVDRVANGDNPLEVLATAAQEAAARGISPGEYLGVDLDELDDSEEDDGEGPGDL